MHTPRGTGRAAEQDDLLTIPAAYLLTHDDLFAPLPLVMSKRLRDGCDRRRAEREMARARRQFRAESNRHRSAAAGTPPRRRGRREWASSNVDRLLAFAERWQPQLLAPKALHDWFSGLMPYALVGTFRERSDRPGVLAVDFREEHAHEAGVPNVPIVLERGGAAGEVVTLRFVDDDDFWIRSRREIVFVAPAGSGQPLRACRMFVEFGRLDAQGRMAYTLRHVHNQTVTPDQLLNNTVNDVAPNLSRRAA